MSPSPPLPDGVPSPPPRSAAALLNLVGDAAFRKRAEEARARPHIDFADPREAARRVIAEEYSFPKGCEDSPLTLAYYRNDFWTWNGARWEPHSLPDIRAVLYRVGILTNAAVRKKHVDDVLDAMRGHTNVPSTTEAPCWRGDATGKPDPADIIAMTNGLFVVGKRALLPATPDFFSMQSLPFAFDASAPLAARFHSFLRDVWKEDEESVRCLRMWFGYCLLPCTTQQKILLIVGPIRSGKGTIARVLQALLGASNTAGPTLGSLALPFGLAPLIGKLLAIISDARLSGRADIATIVENLLRISGEDAVSIQRKYLPDLTTTLKARLMLLCNELPWFTDSAGAIASRCLVLQTRKSFYEKEDVGLTDALIAELPSILLWALAGLDDLRKTGCFVQPDTGLDFRDQMGMLASPVRAFIDARCDTGPTFETSVANLFSAWKEWCERNGYKHPGTSQSFGRDLRAAYPELRVIQHRVPESDRVDRFYLGLGLKAQ